MNAECTYFVLGFHPLKSSDIGSSSAPQRTTAVAATGRGNEVSWSRQSDTRVSRRPVGDCYL